MCAQLFYYAQCPVRTVDTNGLRVAVQMEVPCQIKKAPGLLVIDAGSASWRGMTGQSTTVALADVSGMQAAPPTAAKKRIKLSAGETVLLLEFSDGNTFEKAKHGLQSAIKSAKSTTPGPGTTTEPSASTATTADPPTTAPQRSQTPRQKGSEMDPARLLQNLDLQRRILKDDRELAKTFQETVIAGSLTNDQFWSMRIDLLLTMAQQSSQMRGAYNVLSTIKPVTGADNKVNISLTRERIADMFDQYPIVRKAYNENVPRMSEAMFWQRFFMSRLFLTLRGERVSGNHPPDAILDKYLAVLEEQRKRRWVGPQPGEVPAALDVEGNAEDNPETYGNRPDMSMQFANASSAGGPAGLIRSMNGLSKRLLVGRRKAGSTHHETVADVAAELRLSDLEGPRDDSNAVPLHVNSFEAGGSSVQALETASMDQRRALGGRISVLDLSEVGEDTDAVSAAQSRMDSLLDASMRRHDEREREVESESVHIVHTTTLEFLRQFWRAKTHGGDVMSLRDALERSLDRVSAVQTSVTRDNAMALESLKGQIHVALQTQASTWA